MIQHIHGAFVNKYEQMPLSGDLVHSVNLAPGRLQDVRRHPLARHRQGDCFFQLHWVGHEAFAGLQLPSDQNIVIRKRRFFRRRVRIGRKRFSGRMLATLYSYLNASSASTRLARNAGIYPAAHATPANTSAATASVAGS